MSLFKGNNRGAGSGLHSGPQSEALTGKTTLRAETPREIAVIKGLYELGSSLAYYQVEAGLLGPCQLT